MSDQFRKVYFVRPDGSDDNDGLRNHAEHAFLTIQRAVEAAFHISGLPTSVVTVQVAHGSYAGSINVAGSIPARRDRNGFMIRFIGDEEQPSKVQLEVTNSDAISVSDGASVLIAGMTLATLGSGNIFTATRRATIGHRNCIFGSAASETINASRYAEVYALGPTTVSGGSTTFAHATTRSTISFTSQTITFEEGVSFSRYLWGVNDSTIRLDKSLIVGCATGGISVHIGGVLNVSSLKGEWRGGVEPRVLEGGLVAFGKLPR